MQLCCGQQPPASYIWQPITSMTFTDLQLRAVPLGVPTRIFNIIPFHSLADLCRLGSCPKSWHRGSGGRSSGLGSSRPSGVRSTGTVTTSSSSAPLSEVGKRHYVATFDMTRTFNSVQQSIFTAAKQAAVLLSELVKYFKRLCEIRYT